MEILKIEYVKVFSKSIISAPEARYLSLTILMRETETTRRRKEFRESNTIKQLMAGVANFSQAIKPLIQLKQARGFELPSI